MKPRLVIANNQRQEFVDFHQQLQADEHIYDYVGYRSLLFEFSTEADQAVARFYNVENGRWSDEYGGVYLNGYISTPEIASTAAVVLDYQDVSYVNRELGNAPSLTKLSAYAKLAAANVSIPHTFGGTAYALTKGIQDGIVTLDLPLVVKRADADRGIDNFICRNYDDIVNLLSQQEPRSLWVVQDFIPNDGFYLVSLYHEKPEFAIFRAMGERKDGREDKSHMFKPQGGANASLLTIADTPANVVKTSECAAKALNRQIASVDSIYDPSSDKTYVLEVNYNPQLVTISTFKEVRQKAFLDAIKQIGE